ncbi:MAG: methyltransferase domain-containing protein [Candidatus Rokubacteria bacterium]|nr:methyltransferase domain-containing protein [Candidatus Rokubacteria bacterium]
MKRRLLDYLACPRCANALRLDGPSDRDVMEGMLTCSGCGSTYEVRGGIPRFPLADDHEATKVTRRTQRTYTYTWERVGEPAVEADWEKDSYHYTALIPADLVGGPGRLGLDAGCGAGHDLLRMAESGAELIGFDLSDGVEVAHRLTRHLPNVHVVQGDLNQMPFRAGIFDFIYSFGVLHHLPEPVRGVRNLARLLKPEAPLITYLYEDFGDRTRLERLLIGATRAVRRVTSRIPTAPLYALCWLAAPAVWLTCSAPARALSGVAPRLAERIPFRHTLRCSVLASDLFDRFAPPVEFRYSREGVRALYRQAGLERVESRRYRGWVSWGWLAPSGHVAASR